jgi:hypothetical protein
VEGGGTEVGAAPTDDDDEGEEGGGGGRDDDTAVAADDDGEASDGIDCDGNAWVGDACRELLLGGLELFWLAIGEGLV